MDKLKKKRTAQRTSFTKALNAFNESTTANAADRHQAQVLFYMLEEKMNELSVTSNEIIEHVLGLDTSTAKAIQQEYDDADEYRSKFFMAKTKMQGLSVPQNVNAAQAIVPTINVQSDSEKRFQMPEIELFMFSGDIYEWSDFWSAFKKIHDNNKISNEDKFQCLKQSVVSGSRAGRLVSSYPPTGENYDKVIKSLKNRFGRDDLQIEVCIRELLKLVLEKAISPTKNVDISILYDKIESHLRALETLGVTADKYAALLFPLIESCLPHDLLKIWQRDSRVNHDDTEENPAASIPKDRLNKLISFLGSEVDSDVRVSMAEKGFDFSTDSDNFNEKSKRQKPRFVNKNVPSAAGLIAKNTLITCVFCNLHNHESANCEKAKKMDLSERQECAKKKNACFNCLKIGHAFKTCRVNVKCTICSRKHVDLMCRDFQKTDHSIENKEKVVNDFSLASLSSVSNSETFMQTMRVKLRNGNREIIVRAIIDTGSQKSYVTKEAASRVFYEPIAEQLMTHSLFGGEKTDTVSHKKYRVHLRSLDNNYACNFIALDQSVICDEIPCIQSGEWRDELKQLNIKITDVYDDDRSVSVLIGADIAGKLYTGRLHRLKCGLVAIETYLGWTIMGKVPTVEKNDDPTVNAISMFAKSENVSDLWSLEVLGIKDPIEVKAKREQELEITENFLKNVYKHEDGRYEVNLPWVENHPVLCNNKEVALRRLDSTVKKLKNDGNYKNYDAVFDEWITEGIIEKVPKAEEENFGYYLPHRHIVKENSTTKIRPVFDASAKDRRGTSLNDCLEKGPNLIELVTSALLRFREGSIGVISDVKKAFLQMGINIKDRDFLRFLWYDKEGNIIILRHKRVVFGLTCSPFILGVIINMHLNEIINSENNNVKYDFCTKNIINLKNSLYVDNCVTSVNSFDELNCFISDSKKAMEFAGFDLRGWEFTGDNSYRNQAAVLGIVWNKQRDTLSLNKPSIDNSCEKITKRTILSLSYRVFDPFGLVSPITLCPRILIQDICAKNLSWDDEVSEEIKKKFLHWIDDLKYLDKIEIPRCILGNISDKDRVSIHTFCDASQVAYATVIFIRIENDQSTRVYFLQAKTRIAPCKKKKSDSRHSIPRLELLAATIGIRLTKEVIETLSIKKFDNFYWSDSSTVIAWIKRECNWSPFVYNRVKEIREYSSAEQWGHVPGQLNPADLPSRGCTVSQLRISRWWEGPEWLRSKSGNWPNFKSSFDENEINIELKKSVHKLKTDTDSIVLLSTIKNENNIKNKPWYIEKFSKYSKIVRVLGWILRFYLNCKTKVESRDKSKLLSYKEINSADILLIKLIQKESFTNENDVKIKHLMPFIDSDGLIRFKTRITLRDDLYNFICPIVLPYDHDIVRLIIKENHEKMKHAGVEILMNALRENYWILGGRKVIRKVINNCVSCRRFDAKCLESIPAPLPVNRVRDAAVFEIIGVDYTGPIYLKEGQKAWICLFTCAVYRAVHLELVTSLSTAAFLMALARFIARRGRPRIAYSDNGTNFVGLNNCMNNLDYQKLSKLVSVEKIEWRFNPPAAAWWGGFWERLNGVLKRMLRRTLKKSCLSYEEMLTVILDCESVINSRPITFLSENVQECVPITPSMFLKELEEIGVVDLDKIENCQLGKRFLYRQKIKDDLRKRFRNEYLGKLMYKKQKSVNVTNIKIGDIVLIENENIKRFDWSLARVKDLIFGKDNIVRVVRLTTANGELTRPIQKIYPLEIHCNESDFQNVVVNKLKNDYKSITERKKDVLKETDSVCVNQKEPFVVTRSGRESKKPERLSYK